jgi:transcriptional regulator, propionate catabolism operon regulatory protein
MPTIAVISYKLLTSLVQNLQYPTPKNVSINIFDALLDDAVSLSKKIEKTGGADVFVSAGANARLLSGIVKKPLIEIRVTGFDILKALKTASKYSNQVAIVTYRDKITYIDDIQDVLSINIKQVTYDHIADIETAMDKLLDEGVRTVVASSLALESAKRRGMDGVFLYSSDSVTRALDAAVQVVLSQQEEAEKAEELRTILDFAYGGIIATNRDGIIKVFNPSAERITGIPKVRALGSPIESVLPSSRLAKVVITREPELNRIQTIGNRRIVTNRIPIIIDGVVTGAVATFQDAAAIQEAEEKIRSKLYSKGFLAKSMIEDIIGQSKTILQAKAKAKIYARTDSTVMITGESGTGKELFAQGIHNASARFGKPFVAINCAAFPETLLESELFGYEEGAFTCARKGGKQGLFEMAHGGTIFLDEIAEMPIILQTRLLRVLEEKEVIHIGGERILHVDIRVIAATNKDLARIVAKGFFREDLYYRLNVLNLHVPPLREHPEDIPLIVSKFIAELVPDLPKKDIWTISRHPLMINYSWPGNVRELRNMSERIVVLRPTSDDISTLIRSIFETGTGGEHGHENEIDAILKDVHDNRSEAAKRLGISRTTLWRKLKESESSYCSRKKT